MDAELLELVCGHSLDNIVREPAHVVDQVALWVKDDHYPVLVPRQGAITEGLIIRGLSDESMNRIIFFEGGEFSVQHIDVVKGSRTQENSSTRENVMFFADNELKAVSDMPWCLTQWQRTTKQDTLPRVSRYMQCYGLMNVDEADAYW